MAPNWDHIEEQQEEILSKEGTIKKVLVGFSSAILTIAVASAAASVWAIYGEINGIKEWVKVHEMSVEYGSKQHVGFESRLKYLEDFANAGDRFTKRDGEDLRAEDRRLSDRIRVLEDSRIRIEAKLDRLDERAQEILEKLAAIKAAGGAPHP
jgi:hypothetical protein